MVAEVFPNFVDRFPDLQTLSGATPEEVAEVVEPLGLYRLRSKALVEIARKLAQTGVPKDREQLLELPQVGPYVASATLCFAFDDPRVIVDTNVKRVYSRVFNPGMGENMSDERCWEFAADILPDKQVERYNTALLDFGATVCTAYSPDCDACFASEYCEYYAENID